MDPKTVVEVACAAAREAGREVVGRMGRARDIRMKGPRDLVTDADLAAQEILLDRIHSRFPEHVILSEESPAHERLAEGEVTWVLDPIDGTSNYAHRFPCFSVSIGVVDKEGLLAGVVFDPLRDHLFVAQRGAGARLNDVPIAVSGIAEPMDALVGLDFAAELEIRSSILELMARMGPHVHSFRVTGSAVLGLCYVAAGWADAYFHNALAPWDTAASVLIVREAGGRVTDLDGGPWSLGHPTCLASNGHVHDKLTAFGASTRVGPGRRPPVRSGDSRE